MFSLIEDILSPVHVLLEAVWGDVDVDLAEVALPVAVLSVQVVMESPIVRARAVSELPPADGAADNHLLSPSYHLNVKQRVRKGRTYNN